MKKDALMLMLFSYIVFGSGLTSKPKELTLEDEIREVVEFIKNNGKKVPAIKGYHIYEKTLELEGLRFFFEYADTSASAIPNGIADESDILSFHIIDTKERPKEIFVRNTFFRDGGLNGYFSRINKDDWVDYGLHYVQEKLPSPLPKDWSQDQLRRVQKGYRNALKDIRAEIKKVSPNVNHK